MQITCAVTTAPRRTNYLTQTLGSIADAGFHVSFIAADQAWVQTGQIIPVYRSTTKRLGPLGNFRQALRMLVKQAPDLCLVFQDDIQVTRDLSRHIQWPNLDGAGAVSLYASGPQSHGDGWREVELTPTTQNPLPWRRGCLGACALAMPLEAAKRFLGDNLWPNRTDKLGATVGEWCHQHNLKFLVHNPSYVQHVGDVSCLHDFGINDDRKAGEFLSSFS